MTTVMSAPRPRGPILNHSFVKRCFGLLLVTTSIATSAPAWAQGEDLPDAADRMQYRKAARAIDEKNWVEARRLLVDLWSRRQTYDVASSLGQTEYQLHHPAAGARYMAYALAHVPPKETGEIVRNMRAALEELKKLVAAVRISVNRPSAEVRVDGEKVGTSPLEGDVFVEPGRHVVEARVGPRPDQVDSKVFDFEAGHHYAMELAIANGPSNAEAATPPHSDGSGAGVEARTVVLIAGGAVTAGLLGLSIAEGIRGNNADDDAKALRAQAREALGQNCPLGSALPICQQLEDALDRRNSANKTATFSLLGAGITAAATATLFLLLPDQRRRQPPASGVSASVAPREASISFFTSF